MYYVSMYIWTFIVYTPTWYVYIYIRIHARAHTNAHDHLFTYKHTHTLPRTTHSVAHVWHFERALAEMKVQVEGLIETGVQTFELELSFHDLTKVCVCVRMIWNRFDHDDVCSSTLSVGTALPSLLPHGWTQVYTYARVKSHVWRSHVAHAN